MNNMITCTVTEARTKLSQILKRVYVSRDTVILEKDGLPIAAVINLEELRRLTGKDPFDESLASFSEEWNHPSNNVYDNL